MNMLFTGKHIYLSMVMLLIMGSCSTKKKALTDKRVAVPAIDSAALASERLYTQIRAAANVSDALSFHSTANYNDGKQTAELSVDVSARRGQYVYLSVKALGIVNVARVMIQPDSIRILDLIHRTYISASYRYMQGFTKAPLGFEQLQNLTWANALYEPTAGSTQTESLTPVLKLLTTLNGASQQVVYSERLKPDYISLKEAGKDQELQISFSDFREIDALRYPHHIVIHIQGEKKLDCSFTINNFAGSIKKEPQFVVPKSYKVQIY